MKVAQSPADYQSDRAEPRSQSRCEDATTARDVTQWFLTELRRSMSERPWLTLAIATSAGYVLSAGPPRFAVRFASRIAAEAGLRYAGARFLGWAMTPRSNHETAAR